MASRSEERLVIAAQYAQLTWISSPGGSSAHKLDTDTSDVGLYGRISIAEKIQAAFLFSLSFSTKLSPCLTTISES